MNTVPPNTAFVFLFPRKVKNAVAINLISPQQKIRPQQSTATDLSRDLCLACFLIKFWFAGASARHLVLKIIGMINSNTGFSAKVLAFT